MTVALYTHASMIEHRPGDGHPERPMRLPAVLDALADAGLDLDRREARMATRAELERVHPAAFLDRLATLAPSTGSAPIDSDTWISPGTWEAALRAAGACVEAVEATARGEITRSFCAVRPPGHHAEPDRAMGFCFLSNVAIAARAAQAAGLARVAVVDFDVHHGNGTQAVFEADPDLFMASIHQSPLYPGTGAEHETGVGNIVNATAPPHAPRELWRKLFETRLIPALSGFGPDLVIISAGFDAHRRDPMAHQSLEAEDFAWATRAVVEAAGDTAKGRVVSSLEGGYDLEALGRSAAAHVQALAGG
ncbi:MAG: acetoin utilization protein [Caulobacterales bacterium 32-69-10]|nr:MAG: acetoin utilization protein [Caulobacterales bacterium 32-69-10]